MTLVDNNKVKNLFIENIISKYIQPLEMSIITADGTIYLWNTDTGYRQLIKTFHSQYSAPVLYDFNKDGFADFVIYSGDSRLYIIDGRSGELVFKSELLGENAFSAPIVYTPHRSKVPYIVACSRAGKVYFCVYSPPEYKIIPTKVEGDILSSPILVNNKLLIGTTQGKIDIFSGSTLDRTIDIQRLVCKKIQYSIPFRIVSTPAIGDITGDKKDDAVIFSQERYITAIDLEKQKLHWVSFLPEVSTATEKVLPEILASPLLCDIDKDSLPDIVILSLDGMVWHKRYEWQNNK